MNAITAPTHYEGSIECIDAIHAALGVEAFVAYCRANALKYIWRAGRKGDALEDFQKASTYLVFAANALAGEPLKAGLEPDDQAAMCEDCYGQYQGEIQDLHQEIHRQKDARQRVETALRAKIERQRSQLRSRAAYQTLIPDIQAWQRQTFPDAGVFDYYAKLSEEKNELLRVLSLPQAAEEMADIAICLIGLAQAKRIDLLAEIQKKFEINKTRTWAKDESGSYRHI